MAKFINDNMNLDPLESLFKTKVAKEFEIYDNDDSLARLAALRSSITTLTSLTIGVMGVKRDITPIVEPKIDTVTATLCVGPHSLSQFLSFCVAEFDFKLISDDSYIRYGDCENQEEECQSSRRKIKIEINKLGPFNNEWCVTLSGNSALLFKRSLELLVSEEGANGEIIRQLRFFISKSQRFEIIQMSKAIMNNSIGYNIISPHVISPKHICELRSDSTTKLIEFLVSSKSLMFDSSEKKSFLIAGLSSLNSSSTSITDNLNDIDRGNTISTLHSTPSTDSREQRHPKIIKSQGCFKVLQLTKKEVTFLIGKRGERIEKIRSLSGATIKIIPPDKENNLILHNVNCNSIFQSIRINGNMKEINTAVDLIESSIDEFRSVGGGKYL